MYVVLVRAWHTYIILSPFIQGYSGTSVSLKRKHFCQSAGNLTTKHLNNGFWEKKTSWFPFHFGWSEKGYKREGDLKSVGSLKQGATVKVVRLRSTDEMHLKFCGREKYNITRTWHSLGIETRSASKLLNIRCMWHVLGYSAYMHSHLLANSRRRESGWARFVWENFPVNLPCAQRTVYLRPKQVPHVRKKISFYKAKTKKAQMGGRWKA